MQGLAADLNDLAADCGQSVPEFGELIGSTAIPEPALTCSCGALLVLLLPIASLSPDRIRALPPQGRFLRKMREMALTEMRYAHIKESWLPMGAGEVLRRVRTA